MLKEFRADRRISIEHKTIALLDLSGLRKMAHFTEDYLQLGEVPDEVFRYFAGREAEQRR